MPKKPASLLSEVAGGPFLHSGVALAGAVEDGGQSYRQILVQEYNFSPGGATYQREEQHFNLRQVTNLRLTIVPNKSGSGTATLTTLRLFAERPVRRA